jgi:hypothetical protein
LSVRAKNLSPLQKDSRRASLAGMTYYNGL